MLLLWPLILEYSSSMEAVLPYCYYYGLSSYIAVARRRYYHIATTMASHPIAVARREYFNNANSALASHPIAVAGRRYYHIATSMASHSRV